MVGDASTGDPTIRSRYSFDMLLEAPGWVGRTGTCRIISLNVLLRYPRIKTDRAEKN